MMEGVWVRSQDRRTLVFVKTFEVWEGGRIVARFGKDWKLLGDYGSPLKAQEVLDHTCSFVTSRSTGVFQMPKDKELVIE